MHTGTQSHTQHIKWHHIANSASDAEGRHVLSCCLPVRPSIKQSLVPDSNWADNTVCLIPMVTRSLPHQDTSWLWMWGDWDVHRLLAPIILPSEATAVILVRVLIRSVSDAQVHICGRFRRHRAQATLASTLPFFSLFESIFFKDTWTHRLCIFGQHWLQRNALLSGHQRQLRFF